MRHVLLAVLLAVLPVFVMEGLSGAFFLPLALSYALAVLASMVVALTVTPALGMMLLAKAPLAGSESPIVRGLQRGYDRKLARTLHAPRAALVTVVGLDGITRARRAGGRQTFGEDMSGSTILANIGSRTNMSAALWSTAARKSRGIDENLGARVRGRRTVQPNEQSELPARARAEN